MNWLTSSFINPAMLWGAAAIAAPIIIFLLSRWRYRTIDFAALEFLRRALKKQQRRLRVENLLLLLIRCLIIILFAMVLARPHKVSEREMDEDEKRRNVLIVMDTSYSMGYQLGSNRRGTAHEKAREVAIKIVDGLEDGDRLNIVGFNETVANPVYESPLFMDDREKEKVQGDLSEFGARELELSQRGTNFGGLLNRLPTILRGFDANLKGEVDADKKPQPKTVYLLTDMQRLDFLDETGQPLDRAVPNAVSRIAESAANIVLIDCSPEESPTNVAVTHLATREKVVGEGLTCHIETVIKNLSDHDVSNLEVNYYVDGGAVSGSGEGADQGQKRAHKTVSIDTLKGGAEISPDALTFKFDRAGLHHVEVTVESDNLTIDNSRHHVIHVRESAKVLLVDGEPFREAWQSETDFLSTMLALPMSRNVEMGEGLIRPTVISEAQLGGQELVNFDVVALCNVETLGEDSVLALERYANDGGAVIVTVGGRVGAEEYNRKLWRQGRGLLPCKLKEVRGGTREQARNDPSAPAWSMVLDPLASKDHFVQVFEQKEMIAHLRRPDIFGYYQVELTERRTPLVPIRVVPRPSGDTPDEVTPDDRSAPLLVQSRFGEGRVAVWLTTCDFNWNNTVLYDGFYVPFWRELVLDLTKKADPAVNFVLGERYERIYGQADATEVEIELPLDGQREGVVLKRDEDDQHRLTFPDSNDPRGGLELAGLYRVHRGGVTRGKSGEVFAATLNPREGDLSKFALEELRDKAFKGLPVTAVKPSEVQTSIKASAVVGGGKEYWRHFLIAVICLLALESILAALFGRGRK